MCVCVYARGVYSIATEPYSLEFTIDQFMDRIHHFPPPRGLRRWQFIPKFAWVLYLSNIKMKRNIMVKSEKTVPLQYLSVKFSYSIIDLNTGSSL